MKREYMIRYREQLRMTVEAMARKLRISPWLLTLLENDDKAVTHPEIVKDIAKTYRLTKGQRISLLPENYRPGPGYDPDKYRRMFDEREDLRAYKVAGKQK